MPSEASTVPVHSQARPGSGSAPPELECARGSGAPEVREPEAGTPAMDGLIPLEFAEFQ